MIPVSVHQKRKRRLLDALGNAITCLSSGLGVMVLIAIFVFIFAKGASSLSWDLLKGNYWSKNYLGSMEMAKNHPGSYLRPDTLMADAAFSEKWGIGFVDTVDQNGDSVVLVEYVDAHSPFAAMKDESRKNDDVSMHTEVGFQVENVGYKTKDGNVRMAGNILSQSAEDVAHTLDTSAQSITKAYFKTPGGGIRGSLMATLYLILIALLIALPLGIASAIYLQEYAKANRVTRLLRSAIEMLNGVPSIIFGLMGVAVLFPITQLFGAKTTNVLLGGFTMAIILLPTIIRSTEEALLVVPQSLRDGSLSIGANQAQTIFKIVLPCALPGILSGVMLSIGRVIGESAALVYTMGTYVNDSPTLLSQGTSLAVHIYNIMSSEQPNFELASAISIVILIFVLFLNLTVKLFTRRLKKTGK